MRKWLQRSANSVRRGFDLSIRVMTKVWEVAPYTEGTLLALLALADWANDDGVCYPGLSQLAKKARLTESGARYCLRKLIADGAVSVDKDRGEEGMPRILRVGGQYLPPEGGAVGGGRGGSKPMRNKEEPSLSTTVIEPGICKTCDGMKMLRNKPHEKPHLLPCPECNRDNQFKMAGVGV